jgi:hypothetical protein
VTALRGSIPMLIFVTQLVYLAIVLRNSPLKLSAPEVEYIAASPVNRGSVVLVNFIGSLLLPGLFVSVIGSLVAMLLTWQSAPTMVGVAGLQALVLGVPVCLFSAASGWIVATLKASLGTRAARLALWLAIPAAIVMAAALPQAMLVPGDLWRTTLDAGMNAGALASAAVLLCLACGLLVIAGNRVNMAAIADDSWTYARIQKLGIFGRLYADDVVQSVQRQSRLARKRHLRLAMQTEATVYTVILNRGLLSLFRLAPSSMLRLVMRGVTLAGTISLIARVGGEEHLQVWVLLLMFLIQFRPTELTALFQQDAGQAFTRQFLPANPLLIALADSLFPITLVSFGGLVVLLIQPWLNPLIAVVLVVSLTTSLALCQALELVTVPRLFFRRVPYTYSVVLGGAALIAAGYLLKSAPGVALAAVILNLVLASTLYFSRL